MTPAEYQRKLKQIAPEIKKYIASEFPRRAAKMAVDHFKENFHKSGFVNGGLQAWDKSKRQTAGKKGAASNYKTLLSGRNELMNSIRGRAVNGRAIISSDKPYAQIHNQGGTIHHPGGTAYFVRGSKAIFVKNETASRYQSLHLKPMKRTAAHSIPIPKRQFIGESKELNVMIQQEIERKIKTLFQ